MCLAQEARRANGYRCARIRVTRRQSWRWLRTMLLANLPFRRPSSCIPRRTSRASCALRRGRCALWDQCMCVGLSVIRPIRVYMRTWTKRPHGLPRLACGKRKNLRERETM
ncbi:hypothetical protein B0H12DRAFT_1114107 [Mycena haematopus]|nr:hypothetical protein B0H12DRAFT_1114107 [Mycena haematopus]